MYLMESRKIFRFHVLLSENIMSTLTKIFSAVLGVDENAVTVELSPQNTASWDSLNAIILLTEIEKAFVTRFSYEEAMAVKTFDDVVNLVSSKGKDPYA